MLPPACNWIHSKEGSYLRWNYRTVAIIRMDGIVQLQGWGLERSVQAASYNQGVRFVMRWAAARHSFPGGLKAKGPNTGPTRPTASGDRLSAGYGKIDACRQRAHPLRVALRTGCRKDAELPATYYARSELLCRRKGKVMRAFSCAVLLALCGCSTYQVTPTTNSIPGTRSGQVDVLYAAPQRPYRSVGIVSAKRYKPGWSDPTVSDAIPQLRQAAAQVGADGVIVRGMVPGGGTRFVTVEGEAIRYTDVANDQAGVTSAALAKGFSNGRGSGDVSLVSDSDGRAVYQSTCPAGRTLLIECRGQSCNALNGG